MPNDAYLSRELISSRQRRIYTFVRPLMIVCLAPDQTPYTRTIDAADGYEADGPDPDNALRFLALDRIHDFTLCQWEPARMEPMIGIWVHRDMIASEQIQAPPVVRTRLGDRQ